MNGASDFWRKVEQRGPNDCWIWRGYRNSGKRTAGYGRLDFAGFEGVYAHRVAYLLAHPGAIRLQRGDGPFVLHTCDNPICCNPQHLFLGTHLENMADMRSKERGHKFVSTESPRAKLTEEDVFWIRIQKRYGATKKALALLYQVSEATVSGACYGRHYKDVL